MSKTKTLKQYFKVKSKSLGDSTSLSESGKQVQPVPCIEVGINRKRRSLSLRKTPIMAENNNALASPKSFCIDENNITIASQGSISSNDTIIYSPGTPRKKPSPNFLPTSRNKIYSPSRKRAIHKRNPSVKRNLNNELNNPTTPITAADEVFQQACQGMDDKTIFFLSMIHKYLTTESLKPLLDVQCQRLLELCFKVPNHGMRLVCRLYWWKPGWYTCSQLPFNKGKSENISESTIQQVLTLLVENGFLVKANESEKTMITFEELTEVLKLDELKKICKDLLMKKTNTKEKIIDQLKAFTKVKHNMSNFLTGFKSDNNSRLLKIMRKAAGDCYKLSDIIRDTLYKLYLLMYLGIDYSTIRDKKLELELINHKTAVEVSPIPKSMKIDDASVVFSSKDEFYKYVTAHDIYEDYLKHKDNTEKCRIVRQAFTLYKDISKEDMHRYRTLPQWLQKYTPPYIFIKIMHEGVQDLKREKNESDYQTALDILNVCIEQDMFRQHKRNLWYDVKALILQTLKQYDEAALTLIAAFKSSMRLEEKDFLRKRAKKIATQKNIVVNGHLKGELMDFVKESELLERNLKGEHVYKQPAERSTATHGKIEFMVKEIGSLSYYTAEDYCIKHYTEITREFTHGEHREGRIISAIFFLLFWDIIYCQPPNARGIYLTPYQRYPLDLFTTSFYTNRKKMIDSLLNDIKKWTVNELLHSLHAQWKTKDVEMLGLRDEDWMSLKAVVLGLGHADSDDVGVEVNDMEGRSDDMGGQSVVSSGRRLAALCSHLARDYGYWRSGFPDLTLWNIRTNHIKFIEVKTDADKPSIKQIQWMHYLRQHGIDTAFCYIGTNTTRNRSRPRMDANTEPSILDDIENDGNDSDCDFEPKKDYAKSKSVGSQPGPTEDSSHMFTDDDVVLIPANYVEIVIDE